MACDGRVDFTSFGTTKVAGRACVSYTDFAAQLVLRAITRHLSARLKVRAYNRDRTVLGVVETLLDATPMRMIRRDISSFYETVSHGPLRDTLIYDTGSSTLTRKYLRSFFDVHCTSSSGLGIPRGVGLSALLAELAMRDFDQNVRLIKGVFKYYRFSDDIVTFSTVDDRSTAASLQRFLPCGMEFNRSKSRDTFFPGKEDCKAIRELDYLGYHFKAANRRQKELSREVRVSISSRKLAKIRTRIFRSTQIYSQDQSFPNLFDRIRFLSSNYSIERSSVSYIKERTSVLSGIFYNYHLCGSYSGKYGEVSHQRYNCSELKSLDGFYNAAIMRLARPPHYAFSASELIKLRRLSFFKGYDLRLKAHLAPDRIALLKRAWRHA